MLPAPDPEHKPVQTNIYRNECTKALPKDSILLIFL